MRKRAGIMRLKDIREENEFTQFAISKHLEVSRGTYSVWELETDLIPIRRLNMFCNLCNVSVDYALELTKTRQYNDSKSEIDLNKSKERLKKIRKENHHTQEYIGKKFDLNRSLISKYEKGENIISTTFLIEYAKLYHISCDYLLGKIDEKIILKELVKN